MGEKIIIKATPAPTYRKQEGPPESKFKKRFKTFWKIFGFACGLLVIGLIIFLIIRGGVSSPSDSVISS
jgi:hypothetical protein